MGVSLSVATWSSSLPVAWRLYLPKEWAEDAKRRQKAEVPEEIEFQTKPEIALDRIRAMVEASVVLGLVLADAAYGINTEFRQGLTELGLQYMWVCKARSRFGSGTAQADSDSADRVRRFASAPKLPSGMTEFLQVGVAERVPQVPSDAKNDDLGFETPPLELSGRFRLMHAEAYQTAQTPLQHNPVDGGIRRQP